MKTEKSIDLTRIPESEKDALFVLAHLVERVPGVLVDVIYGFDSAERLVVTYDENKL